MIPDQLQLAVNGAFRSMAGCLEAESHFFELARDFMSAALAINDAVAEVNRTGGSEGITEVENAHLIKMVGCVQEYSNHLMELSKARAAHPFDISPSAN
jgi:hypothetical protein